MADDRIEIELVIDEKSAKKSVDNLTDGAIVSAEAMGDAFTRELTDAFSDIVNESSRAARAFGQQFVTNANLAFRAIERSAANAAGNIRSTLSAATVGVFSGGQVQQSIGVLQRKFSVIPQVLAGAFAGAGAGGIVSLLTKDIDNQGRSVGKLGQVYKRSAEIVDEINAEFRDFNQNLLLSSGFVGMLTGRVAGLNAQLMETRRQFLLIAGNETGAINLGIEIDKEKIKNSAKFVAAQFREVSEEVREDFKSSTSKAFSAIRTGIGGVIKRIRTGIGNALKDAFNPRSILSGIGKIAKSIFSLRGLIVGALAGVGVGAFLTKVTELASIQEDAVKALNVSLSTAGEFSKEASVSFQEFAKELQNVSKFGDEVILQQSALARNFARSNEEAQRLVAASVDLSAATGLTLDSAIRNLGKTFSGLTGELGESVPIIRTLTAEQLKAGDAIDLLANRFAGTALGQIRTFSGALTQLKNIFGDVLETIGQTITESPVVVGLIRGFSEVFVNLNKGIETTDFNFDAFLINATKRFLNFGKAAVFVIRSINDFIDDQTIVLLDARKAWTGLSLAIQDFAANNAVLKALRPEKVQQNIEEALKKTRSEYEKLNKEIEEITKSNISANETFDKLTQGIDNVGKILFKNIELIQKNGLGEAIVNSTQKAVDQVPKDIADLRRQIALLRVDATIAISETFGEDSDAFNENANLFRNISEAGKAELEDLKGRLQSFTQTTKQFSDSVKQALVNGLANTISNAIQSVINAIAKGENALQALGSAILNTFGDLAIQLGQFFIAYGLAKQILENFGPGGSAIAVGAGLVALGSILKAVGGGGPSSAGAGSSVTPPLADLNPGGASEDVADPSAAVSVTIQGDVFDTEDTGLRIADILKDQGFNNAVVS